MLCFEKWWFVCILIYTWATNFPYFSFCLIGKGKFEQCHIFRHDVSSSRSQWLYVIFSHKKCISLWVVFLIEILENNWKLIKKLKGHLAKRQWYHMSIMEGEVKLCVVDSEIKQVKILLLFPITDQINIKKKNRI